MKYIKTLEKWDGFDWIATEEEKQLSRVGNYVIINSMDATPIENEFFHNTIGQIVKVEQNRMSRIENYYYYIKYPKYHIALNPHNIYKAESYEIMLEFKNKEYLELFIASKKYNI